MKDFKSNEKKEFKIMAEKKEAKQPKASIYQGRKCPDVSKLKKEDFSNRTLEDCQAMEEFGQAVKPGYCNKCGQHINHVCPKGDS